jgi:phage anti-repressor protein
MNGHNNLIHIQKVKGIIQNHDQSLCNARDLHTFLEVGKDFSTWIKDRIQQHGFFENQDVIFIPNFGGNPNGGRPSKEYHLTIEAAKHISMAEHTPKGQEARQYFIECERIVLEELRRTPGLPSLDEPPICMLIPRATEILCIGDDGLMEFGFSGNRNIGLDVRIVIGTPTPLFIAMANSQLQLPHPDVFGLPLWLEMHGREAFVTTPKYPLDSEPKDHIMLPRSKTLIIGHHGAIDRLIDERGYTITRFLSRNYGGGK